MNNVQEIFSPKNVLLWIIVGAFALVILKIVGITIRNSDQIFGDSETFTMETYDSEYKELGPKSKVIATLNDNTYHLQGCPKIIGITEKMNYNAAISKSVTPCSICISDGF